MLPLHRTSRGYWEVYKYQGYAVFPTFTAALLYYLFDIR